MSQPASQPNGGRLLHRISPRVAALSVVGLALIGVGIALTPARAGVCASWTDDKGDASALIFPNDPNLDILTTSVSFEAGNLVTVITLDDLASGPDFNPEGDAFRVGFTVGDKDVEISSYRDALFGGDATIDAGATTAPATAVYDLERNTVTFTVKDADVTVALGSSIEGKQATKFHSSTLGTTPVADAPPYDDSAAADSLSATIGSSCSGVAAAPPAASPGAPAPTSAPSASPSAGPSAAPSAAPSGSPSVSPSGSPKPATPTVFTGYPVPRKACYDYADPADDSSAATFGFFPYPGADDDTEIVGVAHRTEAGAVKSFIKVNALGANGPTTDTADGDLFTWKFTVAGKDVVVSAGRTSSGPVPVKATVGGADKTTVLKATAVFDAKNSFVILGVDQGGLSEAVGSSVRPGVQLTKVSEATTWTDIFGFDTDSDAAAAAKPADQVYSIAGPDACFYPLPGKIAFEPIKAAQYGDNLDIGLTFTDSGDAGTEGQTLYVSLPKQKTYTVKTDADGFATLLLPATVAAGKQTLSVLFLGDQDTGRTTGATTVTISIEKTVLALTSAKAGSARTITVTLLDDDKHAVSGQRVSVTVGNKGQSVTTDSKGRATIKNVKPGTTVTANYSGASGKYSGSKKSIKA